MRHLLFVYGTLMRGCDNHEQLAGQRFVGEAETAPCYRLYLLDGYPGLVVAEGNGRSIKGEIWEIDALTLPRLDLFEGVPEALYRRARAQLRPPHDGLPVETYLYLRTISGMRDLEGQWR